MVAIYLSHGDMDPYDMVNGHILSQYYHGSIVYWSMTMPSINLHRALVCLAWGWSTHILSNDFFHLLMSAPFTNAFTLIFYQVFQPLFPVMTSYFGGHLLHTHLSHIWVSYGSVAIGEFVEIAIVALKGHIFHIGKCHISYKNLSPLKIGHSFHFEVSY